MVEDYDALLARASEYLEVRFNPYHGYHGHFAEGGNPPGGGGGAAEARQAVRTAKTVDEVNQNAMVAAQQIAGHQINFALDEPLPLAREHADAILGQLEQYPGVKLKSVGMDNSVAAADEFSSTSADGTSILFSGPQAAQGEFAYRSALQGGSALNMQVASTPGDVAVHEFGHVVADSYSLNARSMERAQLYANQGGGSLQFQRESISMYAGTNSEEFVAEAFTDVNKNGDRAATISHIMVGGMNEDIRTLSSGKSLLPVRLGGRPTLPLGHGQMGGNAGQVDITGGEYAQVKAAGLVH